MDSCQMYLNNVSHPHVLPGDDHYISPYPTVSDHTFGYEFVSEQPEEGFNMLGWATDMINQGILPGPSYAVDYPFSPSSPLSEGPAPATATQPLPLLSPTSSGAPASDGSISSYPESTRNFPFSPTTPLREISLTIDQPSSPVPSPPPPPEPAQPQLSVDEALVPKVEEVPSLPLPLSQPEPIKLIIRCEIGECGKIFSRREDLRKHFQANKYLGGHGFHTGKQGRTYVNCPWGSCSKVLCQSSLWDHVVTHLQTSLLCLTCGGYEYSNSRHDSFIKHVRLVHGGVSATPAFMEIDNATLRAMRQKVDQERRERAGVWSGARVMAKVKAEVNGVTNYREALLKKRNNRALRLADPVVKQEQDGEPILLS
ncbi:hypothetical protein CPC08DRAFT_824107 [Agrocybe pediades]|nr:hypothetical protein CPC08DRAFT_824107 [Agrocybe pediades]